MIVTPWFICIGPVCIPVYGEHSALCRRWLYLFYKGQPSALLWPRVPARTHALLVRERMVPMRGRMHMGGQRYCGVWFLCALPQKRVAGAIGVPLAESPALVGTCAPRAT